VPPPQGAQPDVPQDAS
jgi:hypothetical protein